jgi:hypothetical protein
VAVEANVSPDVLTSPFAGSARPPQSTAVHVGALPDHRPLARHVLVVSPTGLYQTCSGGISH